jgi:UDP-N-acetylmuramate--alanine ligase
MMAERSNLVGKEKAKKHIHLVGIGGAGLSAIAKVLLEEGYQVSGSDLKLSPLTDSLAAAGARISEGHAAQNVEGAHLVVVSSAIPPDNVEVVAAREKGLPVVKRAQILGEMMAGRYGIAVAGTHGKTTTTGMIACVLLEAGCDPTFIVGGVLQNLGTNARAGRGPHFVIEADEYDRTFLGLSPRLAVVTNIEMDHPDCYRDLEDMTDAFRTFLRPIPTIIGCADEARVRELLTEFAAEEHKVITYGLTEGVEWRAVAIQPGQFSLQHGSKPLGRFGLQVPGVHNVRNALAAIAAASEVGISLADTERALRCFQGARRRFEHKGTVGGVVVIDDYAHHPTEIRATLAAARERYPDRDLWAVFQPHTYSRTKALFADFVRSFDQADHVIVTDIYAAREHDDLGIQAHDLVAAMRHRDARHIPSLDETVEYLLQHLRPGSVLVTLGAGDGCLVGEKVLAIRKDKEA